MIIKAKSRPKTRLDRCIISWLGRWFLVQTSEDEDAIDLQEILEIKALLQESLSSEEEAE